MTRVQVLLSKSQNEKLSNLAERLGTSKSGLIREALDFFLRERVSTGSDPLLDLIGQAGKAGKRDISSRHDDYLRKEEEKRWVRERSS